MRTAVSSAQQSAQPLSTPDSPSPEPQPEVPPGLFLDQSGDVTSNESAINEEYAVRYRASLSPTAGDSLHLQTSILQMASTIRLPPLSLRLSLISSFTERGSTWIPIVNLSEIEQLASQSLASPLLSAVLAAGSRLSAAPNALDYGERCYLYSKLHFFLGSPASTLRLITMTILLTWWNPNGPELDSSGLWLRISVGLAHRLALHREPDPALPDARLRRRVWWTLVVS